VNNNRAAGGGGTDIRLGADSLYARAICAGGGGGHCNSTPGNVRWRYKWWQQEYRRLFTCGRWRRCY